MGAVSVVPRHLSITISLILALVCTFHSGVTFHDTYQADIRFPGNPNYIDDNATDGITGYGYVENSTLSPNDTSADNPTCFADRYIGPDGTLVTGNYAAWMKYWQDEGNSGRDA